jgi:signal transduction histidine kinase
VVSHELRTPLTSIKGSLGLVLSGGTGEVAEKSRELLILAERNTDRLTGLVNDILDFEKLRSGEMQFADLRFDLAHLMGDTVSECAPLAEQFGIEYVWKSPAKIINVSGDAARIGQVITNILSNAAKFSPASEKIGIRVCSENGRARVEVSDRGPGIDESLREAIFERFTQGDQSDTRHGMGTGLGLSICKSIIDHHLGDIDFRANEGGGTTFFFELPLTA